MTRAGNQRLPLLRGLALLGLGVVWAAACGGPQKQTGAGAVCFRFDDCQPGFACVPQTKGSSTSVCSADVSGIVSMVDGAPLEAAAPLPDAAAAGGSYAGSNTAPVGGSNAAGATNPPAGGSGGAAPGKGGSGGAATAGAPGKGGSGGAATAGAPAGGSAGAGPGAGSGGVLAGSGGATAGSGG